MKKLKYGLLFTLMLVTLMSLPMSVNAAAITKVTVTLPEEWVEGTSGNYAPKGIVVGDSSLYSTIGGGYHTGTDVNSRTAPRVSGNFVAGEKYVLAILLKPTSGSVFMPSVTATINGMPATVFHSTYEIAIQVVITAKEKYIVTPRTNYTFPAKTAGYSISDGYKFTVQNNFTELITVSTNFSGAGASAFNITTALPGNPTTNVKIGKNGKVEFTINPKFDLAPGTYNATVTVTDLYTVNKSFDISFTVNHNPSTLYSITVQDDGNGIAWAEKTSATTGTNISLYTNAKPGFMFKKWSVISGGVPVMGSEFTMGTANVVVKALFEPIPTPSTTYTITVKDGTSNKATAKAGESITITAGDASEGKIFDKWTTSDGVIFSDPSNSVTTFTMPSKNVTVTANYKDLPVGTYAINIQGDGNGTADANLSATKPGEEIILTSKANEGYHFVRWEVTGGNVTITDNKFIMPKDNVTIMAVFERDTIITPIKENKFNWLWIPFGILGIVAIGSGIVFILIRKKEKDTTENANREENK